MNSAFSLLSDGVIFQNLCILSLPTWVRDQVLDDDSDWNLLALKAYGIFMVNNEIQTFASGFLLKEIFDRFSRKLNSTLSPNRSLWLYFAHDTTIHDMLISLGLKVVSG